jgi:hypothetical protein
MTYTVGRGVRIEIGTEGAPKNVTEVTATKPPVATSAAHTLLVKSVAYFSVATGMPELEGQAVRFSAVDANTLTLEDLDATNYGDFTAGTLIPITSWTTLIPLTDYSKAGGEADQLETTVLMDNTKQMDNGMNSAETITFTGRSETISSAGMQKVREAARAGAYLVFRMTLKDGNVRIFRGQVSGMSEQVATSQVGTTGFQVTVKRYVLEGAA